MDDGREGLSTNLKYLKAIKYLNCARESSICQHILVFINRFVASSLMSTFEKASTLPVELTTCTVTVLKLVALFSLQFTV